MGYDRQKFTQLGFALSVLVTDRLSYQITARTWTDQGYLRVPGRVARTGLQKYTAGELQLTDRKPTEIVNVYRPPEEVFSDESLKSYEDVDVTDGHPDSMVDARSFKDVAVGHTTDAAYADGDYVVADMIIKDQNAIDAVQKGKASLSAGYEAEYHHEPGTTQDGESYEFVQRNIRINHVALVDQARAGREARLYDHSQQRGKPMGTVTIDGQSVEVQDQATAQLIQRAFDAQAKSNEELETKAKELEDEAKSLREQKETADAEKDKAIEERDEAKKAASDEAIQERIQAITDARTKAVKIAGDQFTCDSMDPMVIRREALKTARPTVDWDDKSDHYVQAAWDMEMERTTADRAADSHAAFGQDMAARPTDDAGGAGTQAYGEFLSGRQH